MMDMIGFNFQKWYYEIASEDERALWNRAAEMGHDYLDDMVFADGTCTESFKKVLAKSTKGSVYDDDYMDGEWTDDYAPLPDSIEYFGFNFVRTKVVDNSNKSGYFNVVDDIPEIVINKNYIDDDPTIAHELIHLYEYVLDEYKPIFRDAVFWGIYQNLKKRVTGLDDAISYFLDLLNTEEINKEGGNHDLLFFVKSIDIDVNMKLPLGTVFGYEQDEVLNECHVVGKGETTNGN